MLKRLFRKIAPAPRLVHIPVGCPPLQHYPGYLPEDAGLVSRYAKAKASISDDYYIDGFGVKTEFASVPFCDPLNLSAERLQFPLPDDGFHAEGIEYAALLDAFDNRKVKGRFTAVEVGSGWGPWIAMAGVLARQHDVNRLCLIGAEASAERYSLMCRHLETNALVVGDGVNISTFQGAVWTHDGEVAFPESDVGDMGSAATASHSSKDYRGFSVNLGSVPCRTLSTLCEGVGEIDFLHMDVQGAEYELVEGELPWLNRHVRSLMVATHSRIIEGAIMRILTDAGWRLRREKPCRFRFEGETADWVGRTEADGSQHWEKLL